MTTKHFEAIATDIKWQVLVAREETDEAHEFALRRLHVLACDVAATLSRFNTNFNRTRFLTACGF
jgi:hypothetical protein